MTGSQQSPQPWKEWLQRDDRSWLTALAQRKWNPQECHKSLRPVLESIVTSLHLSCHPRWGQRPADAKMDELLLSFLTWMVSAQEWKHMEDSWKKSKGSWSLPLALSRAYVRYREGLLSDKNVTRSHSGTRAFLELPPPAHMAGPLSGVILDAFGSLAQTLPENLKLPYQLHLEGLLNKEIAALLLQNESEIQEAIHQAKDILLAGMPRRKAS